MDFLWTNYDSDIFYISDELPPCPCEELGSQVSERRGEKIVSTAKINFMLRFSDIFLPLIDFFDEQKISERREIENIFYHVLAQIDFLCGKHKFFFVEQIIYDELEKNFYGKRAGEIFRQLNVRDRKKFVKVLRKQEEFHGRELFFADAVKYIFSDSKLYFYEDEKKFFIYLPQEENETDKLILELLEILFLDISCLPPEIFWKNHFGIIDEPVTMLIDNISIY